MKKVLKQIRFALPLLLFAALVLVRPVLVGREKIPASSVVSALHEHKLSLEYDVYAAGFKALRASLKINQDEKNYDIALEAETQGFIGKLFPWETSTSTMGHVGSKGALIPSLHTDRSTWRKNTSVTEIHYDPQGNALKMTTQDSSKLPVDTNMDSVLSNHAVDVLTGIVALLQNADVAHKCAGKAPVFDGKRRFDITLTDDGTEVLPPSQYSHFSGEAMRCILTVVPVAGFDVKDKKRGWMAIQNYTEARHKLPTLWLARIKEGDQILPVRMEIASAYGSVVADFANYVDH